jgi:hypothetical protein
VELCVSTVVESPATLAAIIAASALGAAELPALVQRLREPVPAFLARHAPIGAWEFHIVCKM